MFSVNQTDCVKCGTCAEVCPLGLIRLEGTETYPTVGAAQENNCIRCGHCEAACPQGAWKLSDSVTKAIPTGTVAPITSEQIALYMQSRRSIRNYKADPVDKATLEQWLALAPYAPTGKNVRAIQWVMVYDTKELRRLTEITIDWMRQMVQAKHPLAEQMAFAYLVKNYEAGNDVICRNAPHLILAHAPKAYPVAATDATIALTYLELAAPAYGLGVCWAGFFYIAAMYSPELQQALGLPKGHAAFGALMVGYPKHKYHRVPQRKDLKMTWK